MENRQAHRSAQLWLKLSLLALGLAGVFAFVVGAVRSDQVQALIPIRDYFAIALTVHVDLSVLVWLLGIAACWLAVGQSSRVVHFSAWAALLAVGIITLSAFFNQPVAYLNNYVPLIDSTLFLAGIILFLAAIGVTFIWQMLNTPCHALGWHVIVPSLAAFAAWALVPLLYRTQLQALVPAYYYEVLFWAGGHILQFTFAALAMLCWLKLAEHIGLKTGLSQRCMMGLFWFNTLCALSGLVGLIFEPTSSAYRTFYTQHMRGLGGIASAVMMVWLLWHYLCVKLQHNYRHILLMSLLLYLAGGVLSLLIRSPQSTMIPAHYHGAIVAVTLATMGLTYLLLPKLGYGTPKGKMVTWQSYLYGGGQLVHILGLAVSGGYGAVRKTPGTLEHVAGQIAMGVMGVGMLLTIIGGALFVIICLRFMRHKAR